MMTEKRTWNGLIYVGVGLTILLVAAFILTSRCASAQVMMPENILLDDDTYADIETTDKENVYHVTLLAGRSRIPKVICNNATNIMQAVIPDSGTTGTATVTVNNKTYSIVFERKAITVGNEVQVQYDDRYQMPNTEPYVVQSNDYFSIDMTGLITVKKAGGLGRISTFSGKTYTIRTIKAPLNIVMIVGQSIASGKGGDANRAPSIIPGTGYDTGYYWDGSNCNTGYTGFTSLRDTLGNGVGVQGITQAFTNRWYELTGEKNVYINAAKSGVSIVNWQPGKGVYDKAIRKYQQLVAYLTTGEGSTNYEINRCFFAFNHGSANKKMEATEYQAYLYELFCRLYNQGFDFGTLFECYVANASTPRQVQAQVVSSFGSLYFGTRLYGQMSPSLMSDSTHPNQSGYDYIAKNLADGTYSQVVLGNTVNPDWTEITTLKTSVKNVTYSGKALKPTVKIYDGSTQLREGVDYTLQYSNNINAGKGVVTITGIGQKYFGTNAVNFTIKKRSLANSKTKITIKKKKVKQTGKAIKPKVTVKRYGKTLKLNRDYRVVYSNNKKVGKATIKIYGKGNYTGLKKTYFHIIKK